MDCKLQAIASSCQKVTYQRQSDYEESVSLAYGSKGNKTCSHPEVVFLGKQEMATKTYPELHEARSDWFMVRQGRRLTLSLRL